MNMTLFRADIWPCSKECVDGVGMGPYEDGDIWHNTMCPNHPDRVEERVEERIKAAARSVS